MAPDTVAMPGRSDETLFTAALDLPPGDRAGFLDRSCGRDPAQGARVGRLLELHSRSDRFFGSGADYFHRSIGDLTNFADRLPMDHGPPGEQTGDRIGPYHLLEKIGEGGNGVIYMARQENPIRRMVAMKIIKLGMDTRSVIARFEAERQALAMMDHPNISRVLDAGSTEAGRPYFVMELVRGTAITNFCNERKLGNRERIRLFIDVCHAIQHAHQKGIIHRDLKPSNILVTLHDDKPVPKVIDFGIAKATEVPLTEKTLFTGYAQFIGTPAYMSPEQADFSGLDIDTRSDIYSLGVVLYELLTGRPPFDAVELLSSGLDAMRRTLLESEPPRPSRRLDLLSPADLTMTAGQRRADPQRLGSQLRGDLDWVVMKTLEKDRKRRYETVFGLALDLQRYLNDEPVSARSPTRLYRLRKLIRRNKVSFLSGGLIAVALLAGLGSSTYLLLREREVTRRLKQAEHQQAILRVQAEKGLEEEAKLRRLSEAREVFTEAVELIRKRNNEGADALVADQTPPLSIPGSAHVFRRLGEWHAMNGRWAEAADRFSRLIVVNAEEPADVPSLDHLKCGTVLAEAGDLENFEILRRMMFKRYADAFGGIAPERALKIAMLLPANENLLAEAGPLTDTLGASIRHDRPPNGPDYRSQLLLWRMISVSLAEYRRGNPAAAREFAERCIKGEGAVAQQKAAALVILSLSWLREGDVFTARARMEEGKRLIEVALANGLGGLKEQDGLWADWVIARMLLREAEAAMDGL